MRMASRADVTIIGGGPIGLFGLYCAGLNGLRAQLLERLDQVGGQLTHLYPEKPIYDVGGIPEITGRELVERLKRQAFQYDADVVTDVVAERLEVGTEGYRLLTNRGTYESPAVVITAGIGQFVPRRMNIQAIDHYEGRGLYYVVKDLREFDGKRVLVVGGGDSAADWAMAVADRAESVVMIHRRAQFQCHYDSLKRLMRHPRVDLRPHRSLKAVHGDHTVEHVILQAGPDETESLAVDRVIVAIGLIPDTAIFRNWGLPMEGSEIRVASDMNAGRPGLYAAGDIATYPGKVKLIAAGFGEVATAMEAVLRGRPIET